MKSKLTRYSTAQCAANNFLFGERRRKRNNWKRGNKIGKPHKHVTNGIKRTRKLNLPNKRYNLIFIGTLFLNPACSVSQNKTNQENGNWTTLVRRRRRIWSEKP